MLRVSISAAALLVTTAASAATCGDLTGKSYGAATIVVATSVAGPSSFLGKDPPQPTALDAPFCRIEGVIKPTSDSNIRFEVWLPPVEKWNGKLEAVGNGGFAGSLIFPSMKRALDQGYATTATDTGHEGASLDAGWALGHPERITDFGWRGVHETAIASKTIVAEYYGKPATHAYFAGCSDGGREALMGAAFSARLQRHRRRRTGGRLEPAVCQRTRRSSGALGARRLAVAGRPGARD